MPLRHTDVFATVGDIMYAVIIYPLAGPIRPRERTVPLDKRPRNITLRGRRLCEMGQCTKYARRRRRRRDVQMSRRVSSALYFFQELSLSLSLSCSSLFMRDTRGYSSARAIRNERATYPKVYLGEGESTYRCGCPLLPTVIVARVLHNRVIYAVVPARSFARGLAERDGIDFCPTRNIAAPTARELSAIRCLDTFTNCSSEMQTDKILHFDEFSARPAKFSFGG